MLYLDRHSARRRNGPPAIRPNPQMIGSALGETLRSWAAARTPIATPINPARQVRMPKMRLTLKIHIKTTL